MRVGVIEPDGKFLVCEARMVDYSEGVFYIYAGEDLGNPIGSAELTPEEARSVFRILVRDGVVRIHLGEHPMIYGRD